jgi:hypothetical protein
MEHIRVEVEIEDRGKIESIEVEGGDFDALLKAVRALAALDEVHVFERDADEPIGGIKDKKTLSVVAHRCKRVDVQVRFEHQTKAHEFAPSATVFRVLQWAIGKRGFNLDETARAKANLILPGGRSAAADRRRDRQPGQAPRVQADRRPDAAGFHEWVRRSSRRPGAP